ncbi:MAG TPA: PaaI family thioesterase [Mycobacteriales bacterium]|nr:PaaI family thioesterase [Mycobacteriales bacterium]
MTNAADELADAVRRFLDAAVASRADDASLLSARRRVEQATAELTDSRRTEAGPIHTSAFRHAHSIVTGTANAIAPPVALTVTDGEVRGAFRLGKRYEGAPGLAHGGVLCLVLDHVLGEAALAQRVGGMTVGLDVRFLAPTRLESDLEVVARVDRVDGRKVHLVGAITHDGKPTATATAVFVQIDAAKAAELFPQLSAP